MTENSRYTQIDRQLASRDLAHQKRAFSLPCCLFVCLIFGVLTLGGCQAPLSPLPNPTGPNTAVRLSPGDVIKLSFAEESDLDQVQRIRRDGMVSLPFLGQVRAAGKTVIGFQDELVRRYNNDLENPEVLVILENSAPTVTVAGFANKPGTITFDRPTTVYQAIMAAGGVSDYGSASNIRLTRVVDGVQRAETINLRPSIRGRPINPEYVQDGDVIYIPRSLF